MNNKELLEKCTSEQLALINKMTPELNRRFCLDRKIPLKIYIGEIFIDRLKLFGEFDNYLRFCTEYSNRFSNTQEYFAEYNAVKDRAIDYIKNSDAFKALNNDDMNKYQSKYKFPQADVYKGNNIGRKFLSIDMSKANFTSLMIYGETVNTPFFESYDYKEFMRQFTDIEHIIDSKYIRQVVFGNCNPKRQVTYEKYLMSLVLNHLFTMNLISEHDVKSLCSDEIIIDVTNMEVSKVAEICDNLDVMNIVLKTEYFALGKIEGSDAYIKKVYNDFNDLSKAEYVVKCASPEEAPFIYRLINNQEFKDSDSVFNYNGKLAKLLEQPELSIDFG